DILACGRNKGPIAVAVQQAFGISGKKLHGEMDAFQIPAFDGKVAGVGSAGAEDNAVEVSEELRGRKIFAYFTSANKLDAFLLEHLYSAQHDLLFVELHVRNAVH